MELSDKEKSLLALAEKYGWDAQKISVDYGKSYANTCYKLYELAEKVPEKSPFAIKVEVANNGSKSTSTEEIQEINNGEDIVNLNAFTPKDNQLSYIKRDVDDELDFWCNIKNSKGYKESVALIGEAGAGKNELVTRFAKDNDLPLLVIPSEDSQVLNQLLGYWQAINGSTVWKEGLLVQFVKQPSVILFDEVNCLPGSRLFMLHELLENRKLFSKDAPSDVAITMVHKDCNILLAMNPPTAGYSGTNRLNIALGSRPVFIEVPDFSAEEMNIDSGDENNNKLLISFYNEAKRVIKDRSLRASISIRNINRIANALKQGANMGMAVRQGFANSLLATASATERATILDIARTIIGADVIDNKTLNIKSAWD